MSLTYLPVPDQGCSDPGYPKSGVVTNRDACITNRDACITNPDACIMIITRDVQDPGYPKSRGGSEQVP